MSTGIKIRTIPLNTNPTPRPSTSSRPMTSLRPSSSAGRPMTGYGTPIEEQTKSIFEDIISEEYINCLYPGQSLQEFHSISLVIDTSYQSLLNLGDLLPNLTKLVLDNSKLSSIRDLGTGLRSLTSVSLNNCGLNELDGIGVLSNLQSLSVRDNQISDINPMAMHETIEELDLYGNKITDISIGDILSSCPSLKRLTLTNNPIDRAPKYQLIVAALIPHLTLLDGHPVDPNAKKKISNGMILEAASAMQLEQEEMDDERRMEMAILGDECNMAMGYDPLKVGGDYYPVQTARNTEMFPDTGSDLTHGSTVVLAGNMASAMRKRRQPKSKSPDISSPDTSALAVLDSALIDREEKAGRGASSFSFLGEGDITSIVLQGSNPERLTNVGSPRQSATFPSRTASPTGRMRKKDNEKLIRVSTSFDADINTLGVETYDDDELRTSRDFPTSAGGRWIQSPRPDSERLQSSPRQQHRTPSPNTARLRNGLPPSSPPVQRNASRPSSRGLVSGIASIAPSAPFKILVPFTGNDREGGSSVKGQEKNMSSSSVQKSGLWDVSDDSSGDECILPQSRSNSRGKYASIVHRNSVIRSTIESNASKDDEEEDFAIDHMSRRKLCAENVIVQKTAASTNAMKLFASGKSKFPAGQMTTLDQSIVDVRAKTNMLSNHAGRLLGFDLQGSLAAINQWVEEMDSEDDEEPNFGSKFSSTADSMGITPMNLSNSSSKILSRDSILNMCIRGDEANFNGGFVNDEVAHSSEAYENDVLFFDNNIEKTMETAPKSEILEPTKDSTQIKMKSSKSKSKIDSPMRKKKSKSLDQAVEGIEVYQENQTTSTLGSATQLSDDALVSMLRQPPKSIPQMRTKSGFQDFFRGVTEERMKRLLQLAYGNLNDLEREVKMKKRMELLVGVLSPSELS